MNTRTVLSEHIKKNTEALLRHGSFVFWGESTWALDRTTEGNLVLRILLALLLTAFVRFDLWLLKHRGNGISVVGMRS